MIKKFEEFVNEMYSPYEQRMQNRAKDIREFVDYLMNLGVSDQDCKEIDAIAKDANFIYTVEETENILKRLPGCDSIEGITAAVKTIFFGTDEDLKEWCGDFKCPVVMSYYGKLLTGVVCYSDVLNMYSEDEDFGDEGYEWLAIKADEEGILDDDQPDWVSNNWDLLEIDEIDLDKECGWTEK